MERAWKRPLAAAGTADRFVVDDDLVEPHGVGGRPGAEPQIGLFAETVNGSNYALAYVTPQLQPVAEKRLPRDVVFVIDNSGSMGGPSMSQAKASLIYALDRLDPMDRFNVVRFDDTMDILFPDTVQASRDNVQAAKGFVGRLEASGGTEMIPPLRAPASS